MNYFAKLNLGETILRIFISLIVSMLILYSTAQAQEEGRITGTVVDSDLGEALIGVNVFLEGTTMGAATDLDGRYVIDNVPAGTYNLVFSSIGFAKSTVTDVVVNPGEVVKIDLAMRTESFQTEEVVITAEAAKDSEAGLLVQRQKSISVSDAISAEQISRTGSGDAAEAVKQVVGASVVDGKYVYVRGLGERYSSTQLNGVELPSSDPNKKAFQLDLLPTNLLDNIVTIKTFTPDKPGNFSGGIVDVGTKNFPDAFTFKLSASAAYHGEASLSDNFLTYRGGDSDWLGTDDGTRSIPSILSDPSVEVPNKVAARFNQDEAEKLDAISKSFNNIMDVKQEAPPVNQSYSLSIGDRLSTGEESSFGYLASLTYGRNFSYYENGEIGIYKLNTGSPVLNNQIKLSDAQGTSESSIGGLATLAFNLNSRQQIGGNVFYSRSGTSTSRFQEGHWPQELDNRRIVRNRVLGYVERDILSYQIRGDHYMNFLFGSTFDWSASFATTTQNEPDLRLIFSIEDTSRTPGLYTITGSNFDDPSRYYRELQDNSGTFNFNFTIPFEQWNGATSKLKLGGMYQESDRKFRERIFSYVADNSFFNEVEGDLSEFFSDQYSGITDVDTLSNGSYRYTFGNVLRDNSRDRNNYDGNENIFATYAMIDLPISGRLRFIGGVRYETTETEVISQDTTLGKGNINVNDFLPSANLIYNVAENMNIRIAATQTLARPTFRELAPFSSKEFVNGVELQGNPFLKRTLIQNYDLRWEWFTRSGEILAVSGFYKILKNPIERAFAEGTTESNRIITYTNVEEATILGAEFEARIRLDHFHDLLSNFSIGGNFSVVKSEIDIPQSELNARRAIDSSASSTRELQGQSPYIINFDLSYSNYESGTTASLYYNTFGERLSKVSTNLTPDVFEQPAVQLDFVLNQKLLDKFSVKLSVKNILDSSYKEIYKYRGDEYVYQEFKRGVTYSLGFSYSI